jgi:hypothetical protein
MSATPSELKCEDDYCLNNERVNTTEEAEFQDSGPQQSSEDIIEFLQSDTHKMHLIQTLQSLQYVKFHLKAPKH